LSATNVGKNCHRGEGGVKRNKGGVGKVVESTPGVNFINILSTAFALADPESVKKINNLNVFFTLLVSVGVKGVHRRLMKSSPGV